MRPEAYQLLAERQKTYWWHRARRALASSLLRKYGLPSGCRWIDLGCGPGGNLHLIDRLRPAEIVGVDLSTSALAIAAKESPHARLIEADLNKPLPFSDGEFDVASIFNVLYHDWIKSEAAVLAEVARIVRPGGLLLLTEPAFAILRREMDEAVMTRHRYHIADFREWLPQAGFEVLFASYFTSFGAPLVLVSKLIRRLHSSPKEMQAIDMRPIPASLNELLYAIARAESCLIERGIGMPFGTTLICVAQRNPMAL